ncbi:glycosyltransferase [Fodinicurvata sp. EGI_FJ10296]|uniref:glycosyltransferase n=1 Tax=Fodinicurvata sp. EGI_FJ10296 TaxID=3231908 RepID=UPI0034569B73
MVTNSFAPLVSGVARSVADYAREYRHRGHGVLVVAPEFDNQSEDEAGVMRLPAIQHFNGSDFSVALPFSRLVRSEIDEFRPQIVHSHHPFLLGATAVRIAHHFDCPLVFTHHTMYEQYTHYVPGDSPPLKRFVIDLATHYANLCDQVIAPSESIAAILHRRGVHTPVDVVPTGIRVRDFADGDGAQFRKAYAIPEDAPVFGHVGRLAPEKNLGFLSRAVALVLANHPDAHFLVVGSGPSRVELERLFSERGLSGRVHATGTLEGRKLADAYHAMDAFVFASSSETQGLVLVEAMAARLPVIAIDGTGVRETVVDQYNGRLVPDDVSEQDFADAMKWLLAQPPAERNRLSNGAFETADRLSIERSAARCLELYHRLLDRDGSDRNAEAYRLWAATRRRVATEWALLRSLSESMQSALQSRQFTHDDEP